MGISSLISRFQKPKAELDLELIGSGLRLGQPVELVVSAYPKGNIDLRSGQVAVTCTEQWWEEETGPEGPTLAIRHTRLYEEVRDLSDLRPVASSDAVQHKISFPLPADAPPTAYGSVVEVAWKLSAQMELDNGSVISQDQELLVTMPPLQEQLAQEQLTQDFLAQANPFQIDVSETDSYRDDALEDSSNGGGEGKIIQEAEFRHCTVVLVLASDGLESGGFLEGEIRARTDRPEPIKEVRLELWSTENAGARVVETVRERAVLEQNAHLSAETPNVWSFSLSAPDRLLPTLNLPHTSVSWYIKAILDTGGDSQDYTIQRKVRVITTVQGLKT